MVIRRKLNLSGRSRRIAKADFGGFALGGRGDFEEFALLEAEHACKDVGRELEDLGVEITDDGVVVTAGVLDGIFNGGEGVLEGGEALDGAELRIGFGEGEEAL